MGWLDNLENDLNNQAGPSGINTQSNIIEMVTVTQVEEIQSNTIDQGNHKDIIEIITTSTVEEIKEELSNENIDNNEKKKQEDPPWQIFAEHVTIASLEEAFKNKSRSDRYMFRIALFLASIMIIYESYAIARQYQNMNTVFNDMIVDKTAPFPNITICFSFTINETTFLSQLNEVVSDKDIKFIDRHNLSLDKDGMDFYKSIYTLELNTNTLSSPIYLLMTKLYDKAQEKAIKENKNLFRILLPSCSNFLSNCVFNRISFDCCAVAEYFGLTQQACYHIDFSNVTNMERNETSDSDPIRLNETGFRVDVNNNWNFGMWNERGSASDGFYIFVNKLPAWTGDPTIIPADMDATIILGHPVAVSEKVNVARMKKKSNLKLFGYYDSYGDYCKAEAFVSLVSGSLGCQLPLLSHILPDSCSLRQITIFSLASQGIDDMKNDGTRLTKNLSIKNDDLFRVSTSGLNTLCQPLCSRWSYKILSASYGLIKYQKSLEDNFKSLNQSWSRIRFVMPWKSSIEHNEEFVAKDFLLFGFFLAFCDIGGMMGVYAGFSMITFIQLAFYGGYWFTKRKRKQ